MQTVQKGEKRIPRICAAGHPDLPAGIRQADCDGPPHGLADADGDDLWNACDANEQEAMSGRFVHINCERLRDAILDAQDSAAPGMTATGTGKSNQAAAGSLGCAVWPMWINYRDRTLREMARRGELPGF
jgi:hypothetical protein